jgi:hypothetical protein
MNLHNRIYQFVFFICFFFLQSWSLQVNHPYQIQVEVYDKDSNRIHPSDNLVIELELEHPSYLDITESLPNGTLHNITPRIAGQTTVTAFLHGVRVNGVLQRLSGPPITAMATIDIYEAMAVLPALTALPWDPVSGAVYPQQFEVVGGLAPFSWSANNGSIISGMTQTGRAGLVTQLLGQARVTAAMTRSAHNKAAADVFILPADLLKFSLDSELEFVVGSELTLPLGLYYGKGRELFSQCHLLPYDLLLSDESQIFQAVVEAAGASGADRCASVKVTASKVSHTRLTADLRLPGTVLLTDKVTVAAFLPLAPLSPASGETVLAIDSSRQNWTAFFYSFRRKLHSSTDT